MNEVVNNIFIQYGFLGLFIVAIVWFAKHMFQYFMDQVKANFEENKDHMKAGSEENKALEMAFRDYLIEQAKEHHDIIRQNTNAYKQLFSFFESSLNEHFLKRNELNEELIESVQELTSQIKRIQL